MYEPEAPSKGRGIFASIGELAFLLLIVFLIRTFVFGLYHVPTGSMETTMLVGERFLADKVSYLFRKPTRGEIIAFNDATYQYSDNPGVNLFQRYVWGPSNWTKRIIGIPGDKVRGTIEDGTAVVYVNDKKLDESYLNKYPLIHVLTMDRADAEALLRRNRGRLTGERIEVVKSFDPSKPYNEQPFFRIDPNRIIADEDGKPLLTWPNDVRHFDEGSRVLAQRGSQNYFNGTDEFFVELGDNQYWLMGDNRRGSMDSRVFGPIDGKLIHSKVVFCVWSLDGEDSWPVLDLLKHPIDFWTRVRFSRMFKIIR